MTKPNQSVELLAATDPLARAADALRGSSAGQDRADRKAKLDAVAKEADLLSRDVSKHAARRHADVALRSGLASARLEEGSAKLKALARAATDPADREALKAFSERAGKLVRAVKAAAR